MSSIDLERYPPQGKLTAAEHLGRVIRDRRNALGLSRPEINHRGGPTHQTVYELEFAKKDRVTRRTLRALEHALELTEDTLVNQVLLGDPPLDKWGRPWTIADEDPPPEVFATPHPSAPTNEQRAHQEALHRLMLTMGRRYGTAMIMETASQVVEELTCETTGSQNGHLA